MPIHPQLSPILFDLWPIHRQFKPILINSLSLVLLPTCIFSMKLVHLFTTCTYFQFLLISCQLLFISCDSCSIQGQLSPIHAQFNANSLPIQNTKIPTCVLHIFYTNPNPAQLSFSTWSFKSRLSVSSHILEPKYSSQSKGINKIVSQKASSNRKEHTHHTSTQNWERGPDFD